MNSITGRKSPQRHEKLYKHRERTRKKKAKNGVCYKRCVMATWRQRMAGFSLYRIDKSRFESKKWITKEWHYYISGKKLSAENLLHHAHMEWSVETIHRLLDVRYREDHCRVLNKNIRKNLNMTRKPAINIVKIHKRKHKLKKALSAIMFD